MNELERTALNEILRTVTYIAEKVDQLDSKISLNDSQVHKSTFFILKFFIKTKKMNLTFKNQI